jgi:type I site-specific restriction endonuclease
MSGPLNGSGKRKRADYIPYHKSNIPVAIIEAKDNTHAIGAGMQQALNMRRYWYPTYSAATATGLFFMIETHPAT